MDRFKFASGILTYYVRNQGEQRCRYKLVQWKNKGSFDIFNDISNYVTLSQLEDSSGNVNHTISITGSWMYDSNYKRSLPLMRESLDILFFSIQR